MKRYYSITGERVAVYLQIQPQTPRISLPSRCIITSLLRRQIPVPISIDPILQGLDRRWCQLGTKNLVPETTRYSESILIVHEMVLKVILL